MIIGLVVAIFMMSILLIETPMQYKQAHSAPEIKYFSLNWEFFQNISIAFYSFTNQYGIVTIFNGMDKSKHLRNYSIILHTVHPMNLILCLICFSGYISFGSNVPEIIFLRPPLEGSSDIPMKLCQFGFFIIMIVGATFQIRSTRDIAYFFLKQAKIIKPQKKITFKVKFILNSIFCFVPAVFAYFIKKDFSTFVSLISSVTCPYYIFITPCIYYFYKLFVYKRDI